MPTLSQLTVVDGEAGRNPTEFQNRRVKSHVHDRDRYVQKSGDSLFDILHESREGSSPDTRTSTIVLPRRQTCGRFSNEHIARTSVFYPHFNGKDKSKTVRRGTGKSEGVTSPSGAVSARTDSGQDERVVFLHDSAIGCHRSAIDRINFVRKIKR